MQLNITDNSNFITIDFGKWLIPFIQTKLLSNVGNYDFRGWDKYLTESIDLPRLYTKEYKALEVITFAAKNLLCIGRDGDIIIKFNENQYIPGFNHVKLTTLIKLIEYGTTQRKGVPIFRDTLDYFANNIESYAQKYYGI